MPFREAVELLERLSIAPESAATLPALATDVHSLRQARNAVVHDLATQSGRLAHDIANQPRPPTYSEAMERGYAKAIN